MDKHLTYGGGIVVAIGAAVALSLTSCSGNATGYATLQPEPTHTSTHTQPPTRTSTTTPPVTTTTSTPKTTATTQSPTSTHSMTANPPHLPLSKPTVYYVDEGGDLKVTGSFGTSCGASLIPTYAPDTDHNAVKSAMRSLILHWTPMIGQSGFHNPLYQSRLKFAKSQVNGSTVSVWLTGTLRSPGECADQQIVNQLTHTAASSAGVQHAKVYVNDKLVQNILSLKG